MIWWSLFDSMIIIICNLQIVVLEHSLQNLQTVFWIIFSKLSFPIKFLQIVDLDNLFCKICKLSFWTIPLNIVYHLFCYFANCNFGLFRKSCRVILDIILQIIVPSHIFAFANCCCRSFFANLAKCWVAKNAK